MKSFINAVLGMAVLAAFVLCVIGSTGHLLNDGHILFAIAELVVSAFAAKPMYKYFQTKLL